MTQTILLASDLGLHCSYILQYAVDLATKLRAKILVVHALGTKNEFSDAIVRACSAEGVEACDLNEIENAIHERVIDVVADEMLDAGFDLQMIEDVRVLSGDPADVILEEAEESEADFVVIGSHSFHLHGRGQEDSLGEVAGVILSRARVPVFVVPVLNSLTLYRQQMQAFQAQGSGRLQ